MNGLSVLVFADFIREFIQSDSYSEQNIDVRNLSVVSRSREANPLRILFEFVLVQSNDEARKTETMQISHSR